ncbi:MAG: S8 family peptidase [Halioglobus sp.]
MQITLPWVPIALTLLLVGCGGGGSGGGNSNTPPVTPTPEPTPPPVVTPSGFSISGTVSVSANLGADSDTNNPEAVALPNNSVATAQRISNPSTIGGYVNQPGEGEPGALLENGDSDDYFEIELLAGQTITLLVANFERADADLYLYNTSGQIVDFSIEVGQVESLTIPADGIYIANVFAFFGATNYALAVGSSTGITSAIPAVANSMSADKIIPWQAVVLSQAETPEPAITLTQDRLSARMGMRARAENPGARGHGVGQRQRTQLRRLHHAAVTAQQQMNRLGTAYSKKNQIADLQLRAGWETLLTIKSLKRDPKVIMAEPNYRVHTMATPNDQAYPSQWHYPLISLPAAWDLTTGQPEVIVAVIDTGILSAHPDLAGQLVDGYDFIADPGRARDGTGIDPNPEDAGDGGDLGNSSFHGTHVSGTIAATSNNGIGVAGVAWNARIMPLRVLGVDGGASYDVDQAIRYAAGLANDSGTVPDQRADIINMSLGGAGFSRSTQALINEVTQAGVIIVAAAGNEATNTPGYPASYDGVISVSAVDSQRRAAPYSNFGNRIDIAAPGGNNGIDINGDGYPDGVLSTGGSLAASGTVNFVYSFSNGTSMASPHVAGVMALMKSVNPDLTALDIDALLQSGDLSDDLGAPGRDNIFGHGLINAQRAVVAALSAAGNPPAQNPRLGASSTLLNFGSAGESLSLLLQNSGRGDLGPVAVTTSEDWVQLRAENINNNGVGTYLVSVDRADLASGIYNAKISATSRVNTVEVDILVSVVDETTGGDVGLIYLLLINNETQEAVAQFGASATSGLYPYRFNNIPPGSYEFFAGTDADNDLLICDAGEACGAYLTTDQPVLIELESNLEGIAFPIEYRVAIPNISSLSKSPKESAQPGISRAP